MKKLAVILCATILAGCVSMAKVDSGSHGLGERLTVTIEGPWNHLTAPDLGPAQTWTMEGLPLDQLLLYTGIKDGALVHSKSYGKIRNFAFRATMQPDEIVTMFEGMLTRDGSTFTLTKLEPAIFGGLKGFHFEYNMIRKMDNVILTGVGWGTVSKGELFAMIYMAPRLGFFAQHSAQVEKIALSARIKE